MATVAHMIKYRPVIGLTRSTVAQSGKKLLYLVTSEPRTVAQNRSRILRTFYELRIIVVANIQHSASEGFYLPPAFLRGFPKVLNLAHPQSLALYDGNGLGC